MKRFPIEHDRIALELDVIQAKQRIAAQQKRTSLWRKFLNFVSRWFR